MTGESSNSTRSLLMVGQPPGLVRDSLPPVLRAAPHHFIQPPKHEEIVEFPNYAFMGVQEQKEQPFYQHHQSNERLIQHQQQEQQTLGAASSEKRFASVFPGHDIDTQRYYQADANKDPFADAPVVHNDHVMVKGTRDSYLDDISMKKRRFVYGCIPVAKRSRNICLVFTGIILIMVGVVIYLFYPRSPEMHFVALNPANGGGGQKSYALSNYDPAAPDNFSFTMNMTMTVSVINTNWYHLKVDEIKIKAFVLANGTAINKDVPSPAQALLSNSAVKREWVTNSNYISQIATGHFGAMAFPPSENIIFDIPLLISYTPSKSYGLVNDPAFNEIIQLCVDHDSSKVDASSRKTKIRYEAENSVGILKYIGYTPKQSSDFLINCPFQGICLFFAHLCSNVFIIGAAHDELIKSLKQKH